MEWNRQTERPQPLDWLFKDHDDTGIDKAAFFLKVFHPQELQHTNKYYTSVYKTTFILYTLVYMSGRRVST